MNPFHKIADYFGTFGKKLKEDSQLATIFYTGIVVVLVLIVIICVIICIGPSDKSDDTQGDGKETEETLSDTGTEDAGVSGNDTAVNIPDYTVKDVALEENAYADVNEFVNRYFAAMTTGDTAAIQSMQNDSQEKELLKAEKESAYINEFDSIRVYTKPGPLASSYITFVYYEIKFDGIDTLAPGLTTLYICPNADGSLYINSMLSDQDTEYIKQIVAQDDVADLFSLVETKYGEAVDGDENLKSFMEGLSAKLDAEVSEAMAAIEAGETGAETEEETPQEETPVENVLEEKVQATDTVNVRSSDSENAERIGQIAAGDTITRYEAKANGWSRVNYDGQEGYIKSEFLQPVEQQASSAQTTQPSETQDTPAETQTTDNDTSSTGSLAGKSKITIKETVNVRKSASQESDKIGTAYEGENYELIMEQADGWCKINFNGQTGYVKTEYVKGL